MDDFQGHDIVMISVDLFMFFKCCKMNILSLFIKIFNMMQMCRDLE